MSDAAARGQGGAGARHVVGRAALRAARGVAGRGSRKAQVGDPQVPVGAQEAVLRLEVSVGDAEGVEGADGLGGACKVEAGVGGREGRRVAQLPLHEPEDLPTGTELEEEIHLPGVLVAQGGAPRRRVSSGDTGTGRRSQDCGQAVGGRAFWRALKEQMSLETKGEAT